MAERFETLLKRCRRRRLKRLAKAAAAALLAVVAAGGGLLYLERSAGPADAAVSPPPPAPAPARVAPAPEPAPGSVEAAKPEAASGRLEKRELIALQKEAPREPTAAKIASPDGRTAAAAGAKRRQPVEASSRKRAETPAKKPEVRSEAATPARSETAEPAESPKPVRPVVQVRDVTDASALKRQFEKYPRYATALKIARLYYEKGDYEAASLWAKKANLLDRDDEAAWILYAKSEYALGREERAKRILAIFLDYKDSARARTLLMGWSKTK